MSELDPRRGVPPSAEWADTGGWPPPAAGPRGYGPAPATPGPGWQSGDSRYGRLSGPAGPPPPREPEQRRPEQRRPQRRPATAGVSLTVILIALNVVAFLLQQAIPGLTERYGLNPAAVEAGQYERLLTAAFLHAGLLHIASNMLALFIVGLPLERAIGPVRFGAVYLTSALGGSLLALALSPANSLGVGASGAIFGLFGAVAVLHRRVGADVRGIGTLILLNLVITFALPGISWQAHVGGLVTGAVAGALVGIRRRT